MFTRLLLSTHLEWNYRKAWQSESRKFLCSYISPVFQRNLFSPHSEILRFFFTFYSWHSLLTIPFTPCPCSSVPRALYRTGSLHEGTIEESSYDVTSSRGMILWSESSSSGLICDGLHFFFRSQWRDTKASQLLI